MVAQDYSFLAPSVPPVCISTKRRPACAPARSPLLKPSTPRRIFLHPASLDADNSPSRRAVSFSSWTRFTASGPSSPSGQLKASILCKASGTSSSYDPPASEWAFLGAGQPICVRKDAMLRRRGKSPLRTELARNNMKETMEFPRHPVKRASTISQLTSSIDAASPDDKERGVTMTVNKYGLIGLTCEDLPSAFDSDSEDED